MKKPDPKGHLLSDYIDTTLQDKQIHTGNK